MNFTKILKIWKNHKGFIIGLAIFIIVDIIAGIFMLANKSKSSVYLERHGSTKMSKLISLDNMSHDGVVDKDYANFKFDINVLLTLYHNFDIQKPPL